MQIGPLQFPDKPLALAPMEDVTDISFRLMAKRFGADILYTEFTSSEALIRNAPKAIKKIMVAEEERPVAIQIFGGLETSMEGAARVVEDQGPDFIDINCGCWVKDVVKRNEGAGLLRDLKKFESIVRSTVNATRLPVTVKTRLGWDPKSIVIEDVARMVEAAGAKALAIHCRTRDMGHNGDADWSWLEKVKKTVSIPIIGNGDILDPQSAKRMFETGCDAVMIGRGAIANPFIFREIKHFLKHGELPLPATLEERVSTCLEHLKFSLEYKGQPRGIFEFRKHYSGYFRSLPNIAKLRSDLVQYLEFEQIESRLLEFINENISLKLS